MYWNVLDDLWDFGLPRWVAASRRLSARPSPALNVYGNEEKVVVVSRVPGLAPESMDVQVHNRSLTISGNREAPKLSDKEELVRHERTGGEFSRSLTLPFDVEAEKVEANYENGLLTITLPRVERDKPRRIEIRAGQ